MKQKLQLRILMIVAGLFLLVIAGLAAWIGRDVLNPIRNVTLTSTGPSILASPRAFFKTPAIAAKAGEVVQVPVSIDTNGGSLASIQAELQYNPADMTVALGDTPNSVCRSYTNRSNDEVSGRFTVNCTAPTTVGGQVSPFLTFLVTPRHAGGLPLRLIGRVNDYGVITAQ